jgi:hypothetical protein
LQLKHLLDLIEFGMIMFLGFMPLIVIHWAYRRPKMDIRRSASRFGRHAARVTQIALTAKTSLVLVLTDWFMTIYI